MNKDIMKAVGFGKMVEMVEHGFCPFCNEPISKDGFKDELSKREYKISGLCQKCQDETFKEGKMDKKYLCNQCNKEVSEDEIMPPGDICCDCVDANQELREMMSERNDI